MKISNLIPRFYRMRVKWVGGVNTKTTCGDDFEENIWIFRFWGNPRNIACNSAMWRKRLFGIPEYLNGFNCVTAWYNPIDWKDIWESFKFKFRYFGI